MATIKDVAKVAGVSIATVSRVINQGEKVNQKTRDKVRTVMQQLGYRPNANAQALVTQKSKTLGVVIPELTDPFFALLASGVEAIAKEMGLQLLLSTGTGSAESELDALNILLDRRCEAIVMHSKHISDQKLQQLLGQNPGLVLIDRYIPEVQERCIWLDNIEGGRIAARHLLSLGHKCFACISSEYDIEDPQLRLQGFVETLNEQGISKGTVAVSMATPNQQGGQSATQELLATGQPFTALFAYNDAMASGAISTLEDNGIRVPEDVSIIGFDDVILASFTRPKLTTLKYPVEEMAAQAAQLALMHLDGEVTTMQTEMKHLPSLIRRASCARLR
ncbi:LacI family DNA-binding transcriptional regulator [Thalassotalea mangrovi]|uniref:LacI family DNA-binding transcriptional regulator n=1 Tax=Thalassotalea mangrovi TaxID=2572245 RepID=A0A4U1B1F7_9GAMM|nr:LacI family DNA-binding transcriptional regulator [Thalassotalea mangrovi]TKB43024.1 LacI family DNA-binding transcriptional regulator [Thalassotalea mangrovi]